jgi:hypothetical protein
MIPLYINTPEPVSFVVRYLNSLLVNHSQHSINVVIMVEGQIRDINYITGQQQKNVNILWLWNTFY